MDRLCGQVVSVPGYTTEMYCASCEVRTEFIHCICYVEERRLTLRSSGRSSWLQIQRSGFDSQRYHIFGVIVCLERGPLSLASTTEKLLVRKNRGCGLENREYGRRDPSCFQHEKKLALTSPTSGGRSIGIVRSRPQATKFSFFFR
jgi:hypothetical protein